LNTFKTFKMNVQVFKLCHQDATKRAHGRKFRQSIGCGAARECSTFVGHSFLFCGRPELASPGDLVLPRQEEAMVYAGAVVAIAYP